MFLCENEKNQKGGWTEKKTHYPYMKMKISKGEQKTKTKKNIMSLCEYEKIKKGDGQKQGDHLITRRKGIAT
jgi:hypothetical protein